MPITSPPTPLAHGTSQDGCTPLIVASAHGHSGVLDRLIAARAMVVAADSVVPALTPSGTDERSDPPPPRHVRRCSNRTSSSAIPVGFERYAG